MGGEGIGIWLGVPFFLCVLALCIVVVGDRRPSGYGRTLGIGRGRLAAGYLGMLGSEVLIAAWDTRSDPNQAAWVFLFVVVFGSVLLVVFT